MKRRISLSILLLIVSLASGFLAGRASGGSPVFMTKYALAAAPTQFKMLVENDQIRALEFSGNRSNHHSARMNVTRSFFS